MCASRCPLRAATTTLSNLSSAVSSTVRQARPCAPLPMERYSPLRRQRSVPLMPAAQISVRTQALSCACSTTRRLLNTAIWAYLRPISSLARSYEKGRPSGQWRSCSVLTASRSRYLAEPLISSGRSVPQNIARACPIAPKNLAAQTDAAANAANAACRRSAKTASARACRPISSPARTISRRCAATMAVARLSARGAKAFAANARNPARTISASIFL